MYVYIRCLFCVAWKKASFIIFFSRTRELTRAHKNKKKSRAVLIWLMGQANEETKRHVPEQRQPFFLKAFSMTHDRAGRIRKHTRARARELSVYIYIYILTEEHEKKKKGGSRVLHVLRLLLLLLLLVVLLLKECWCCC